MDFFNLGVGTMNTCKNGLGKGLGKAGLGRDLCQSYGLGRGLGHNTGLGRVLVQKTGLEKGLGRGLG